MSPRAISARIQAPGSRPFRNPGTLRRAVLLGAWLGPLAGLAPAQCIDWYSMGSNTGVSTEASVACTFDPDGPGPSPRWAIVAGPFSIAGGSPASRIAAFDGAIWRPLGAGLSGGLASSSYALFVFDPDAEGPGLPVLIVGGEFTSAGGVPARNIASWDGVEWRALGAGIDGHVRALAAFDPDAQGPLPPSLYVGGAIFGAGSIQTRAIARWDGDWHDVGGGINGSVTSLFPFDTDGAGPEPQRLYVGGVMLYAGNVRTNSIAAWDGADWSALGDGLTGAPVNLVRSMVGFSQGGPERLVVCGAFTMAGDLPVPGVAQWDGHEWSPIGGALAFEPVGLAIVDHDRDGPQPPDLYIGGNAGGLSGRLSKLVGPAWQSITPSPSSGRINSIASVDLGGEGSTGPGVCITGPLNFVGNLQISGVGLYDGAQWWAWGGLGVNNVVMSMEQWDRDGDGPLAPELLMGGTFLTAAGQVATRVTSWNGTRWESFGGQLGPSTDVKAVTSFDFDAGGPMPPSPVIGGYFALVGGLPTQYIARWTGSSWDPIGSGFGSAVLSLDQFDFDGAGPEPARLIAGGVFTSAGSTTVNSIAAWDGTSWVPIGQGLRTAQGVGTVSALTQHTFNDADGPRLVAGGTFARSGTTTLSNIAWFDGQSWRSLGPGFSGQVTSLASFDTDADGPGAPELYAGGYFVATGDSTTSVSRIARWDGAAWQPLTSGCDSVVYALEARDPDGPGPLPQWLFVGGGFTRAGGITSRSVAAWTGTQWISFGSATSGSVYDLDVLPLGPSPSPSLMVGGNFTIVDSMPSAYLGRAEISSPPVLDLQPSDQDADAGDDASFTALALGDPPLDYRWTKDGADLADGPTPDGTIIAGSATGHLTLTGVHPSDEGEYRARIANRCGSTLSDAARLRVRCPSDFNADGTVDFFDYLDFVAAFAVDDPAADLDGNGQVDFFDYLQFVAAFDAGC